MLAREKKVEKGTIRTSLKTIF